MIFYCDGQQARRRRCLRSIMTLSSGSVSEHVMCPQTTGIPYIGAIGILGQIQAQRVDLTVSNATLPIPVKFLIGSNMAGSLTTSLTATRLSVHSQSRATDSK